MVKYQAYDSILDLQLYYQMRDLIARCAGSGSAAKSGLLGAEKPLERIEAQYGFHYPGEALERYKERCGEDIRTVRALALALSDARATLSEHMFIGNQKIIFISQIRKLAISDIFLSGALFHLTESDGEREVLRKRLLGHGFGSTEEILFALSVFGLEEDAWDALFPVAERYLGAERTLRAYGNDGLYSWFLDTYADRIQAHRGRNMGVMKALLQMLFHHIKPESREWGKLAESGYSEQEIIYLNMSLPMSSGHSRSLTITSISMERIAVAGCERILNAEILESTALLELCAEYLRKFWKFHICLQGYEGIVTILRDRVLLRNVEAYCYFYRLSKDLHIPEKWFYVDLAGDGKWDELADRLSKDEYCRVFETCLYEIPLQKPADDSEVLGLWLALYEKLTGEAFADGFWIRKGYTTKRIFAGLIERGRLDILEYFRQYVADEKAMNGDSLNEKWSVMLEHIRTVGSSLRNHAVFRLWEEIDAVYGIQELDRFMASRELLVRAVGFERFSSYGRDDLENFWRGLDFLNREEALKLFGWAEAYLYAHLPSCYNLFLYRFLRKNAKTLMTEKEARELMEIVLPTMNEKSYEARMLRKTLYSEEEWENYVRMEQEAEARKKEAEKQKKLAEFSERIKKSMDEAGSKEGRCKVLGSLLSEFWCLDAECRAIVTEVLDEELALGKLALDRKSLVMLADGMLRLVRHDLLSWGKYQEYIKKLEVSENESAVDQAA